MVAETPQNYLFAWFLREKNVNQFLWEKFLQLSEHAYDLLFHREILLSEL